MMMATSLPPEARKTQVLSTPALLALVSEIGFLIAIPAAVLGFGGAWLDKWAEASPWFTLVGLTFALAASTLGVWHRIKPFLLS